ncbi:hypothetical protein QRD43_13930 [Pelomonas sp. APW6]|uniref:Uncharacterized protein n=1 Tax=Roseateles subflavus TaxID=3053353 RepID=A0ABT7LND8_9BURK|nr:hypothetical protein [Pelomonas sp. APW6]MDL5033011.1 hypothetical protein [Pelomonas sp. APW6]
MAGDTRRGGLLAPMRTREDAEQAARDCARAFFVVAALQTVAGLLLTPWILVDAVIFALCAHFIRSTWSRSAAVIAMICACLGFITTVMNRLGDDLGGGNILLSTLVVLVAARGVEATHKLHGRFKYGSR